MISVCIATYNGEKYIKEQLHSILIQLEDNDEVIISDDHSIDNTIDVIKSLNDHRIKNYTNTKESGYTKNFENALEKANGDIIFLSDQDDLWMKNKVKITVEVLKTYDFVVNDAEIVDENLNLIHASVFKCRNVKQGFITNFIKIKYLGCCLAFKKQVLQKALPFPNNQELSEHDAWLPLISEIFFKVYLIEQPLMKYRRHGENSSLGMAKSKNSLLKKIMKRLYLLYNLVKRLSA
jgi:glycosyltransferase involved in cell wall biosynthesis